MTTSPSRGERRLRSARTYSSSLIVLLMFFGGGVTLCIARALHIPGNLWVLALTDREPGLTLAVAAFVMGSAVLLALIAYTVHELISARKEVRVFSAYRA